MNISDGSSFDGGRRDLVILITERPSGDQEAEHVIKGLATEEGTYLNESRKDSKKHSRRLKQKIHKYFKFSI